MGVDHFDPQVETETISGKAGKLGSGLVLVQHHRRLTVGRHQDVFSLESKTKRKSTRDSGLANPIGLVAAPDGMG